MLQITSLAFIEPRQIVALVELVDEEIAYCQVNKNASREPLNYYEQHARRGSANGHAHDDADGRHEDE